MINMFSCTKVYIRQLYNNSEYLTQALQYSRWVHRKPSRILNSQENNKTISAERINEELLKNDETETKTSKINWRYGSTRQEHNTHPKVNMNIKEQKEKKTYDMLQTVIDANGDVIYTKLPDKDPRITSLLTTVQSHKMQEKNNVVLLEGKRLIKEALENKCKLEYLLFSRKDEIEYLKPFLPKSGATIYKMPYREIQLWSDLTTCPGIMGIFRKPDLENITPISDSVPVMVICDNIRDPGNLGTILRTCAGVGCHSVVLTKGCVHVWDSKVTRSSCGAHFRLKIHTKVDWSDIAKYIEAHSRVFMAENNVLNVSDDELAEMSVRIQSIPVVPYYGIHIDKTESAVIIVGGETEGLSEHAYKLVHNSNGARLNVPLSSGIDSLNAGIALSVILFEIKKQMLLNECYSEKRDSFA